MGGSVARGTYATDPIPEPIAAALRELFFNVKVVRLTVLLLLAEISHVGVVLIVLLDVLFCGG